MANVECVFVLTYDDLEDLVDTISAELLNNRLAPIIEDVTQFLSGYIEQFGVATALVLTHIIKFQAEYYELPHQLDFFVKKHILPLLDKRYNIQFWDK